MTKTKSTKRALLLSALSLLMCVSMLIGSTFAWFTDSVTSSGNIIKSGTLDVTMEWKDATTTGAQQTYKDASAGVNTGAPALTDSAVTVPLAHAPSSETLNGMLKPSVPPP